MFKFHYNHRTITTTHFSNVILIQPYKLKDNIF